MIIGLVQARLGSTRLPNKVIKELAGKPMIEILLTRLSKSSEISKIVVATSTRPENDHLQMLVESLGYESIWVLNLNEFIWVLNVDFAIRFIEVYELLLAWLKK